MANKLYLGVSIKGCDMKRELFRAASTPTFETHGATYNYVIGPFRTKLAGEIMRDFGRSNPHLQSVYDAERLARHYRSYEAFAHR